MRILLATAFSLLSAACGDSASTGGADADIADASCGEALACATWIQEYERDVVAKLSGHAPIAEGLTITARASIAERAATGDFLFAELQAYGLSPERHDYGSGENIVARLPASREDAALLLLGCHFDGVQNSPAAGDDGTGVALVLAAARYFAAQSERENEMIFAFFDEEEKGLIGSGAYAERLRMEDPDLAAAHIFDLISWDQDQDGAVELWSPAEALANQYQSVGDELGIPVRVVDFDSSDHASFTGQGFDSVGVSEEFVSGDFNPNYHTPEDRYENVDFEYLESITRMALEVTGRGQ